MGASSAGSYGGHAARPFACNHAAHRADGSTQRQQPTRQAYGESDPTETPHPSSLAWRAGSAVRASSWAWSIVTSAAVALAVTSTSVSIAEGDRRAG